MAAPIKIIVNKLNNLGETFAAELSVHSDSEASEIKSSMRGVLDAIDDRFREMNLRLLGANANIAKLPAEQQMIWYQSLGMLYGEVPVPPEVMEKVKEAVKAQGSAAFQSERPLPEPEPQPVPKPEPDEPQAP